MRSLAGWTMTRVRRYRPDRNPLRRRSDRMEAALAAVALAAVLLALWPALAVGRVVYDAGSAAERVGPSVRQRVPAVVAAWPPQTLAESRALLGEATVRWTLPSGEVRTGRVPTALLVRTGSRVAVWVDPAGRPTTPPQDRTETVARAGAAGFGVLAAGAALALCVFAVGRAVLDRGRYRDWDDAWAAADRRWRRPRI
ncbi:Rv1733c family protein [Microbispora sp. ATCC PTA-5024]|uniref:Rv1733c family protein n=1 Tax=Microbispora sp. ATCC PTA-5024 TaxID=316330 RepID=UPI0003DC0DEA|nr:hypothetical protein [Microbispora sp. ATCC PTA-5024]ETK38004.1 hypothetical protein MPTA5024_01260 [Microbispora sp. ATCC PTA-5024]